MSRSLVLVAVMGIAAGVAPHAQAPTLSLMASSAVSSPDAPTFRGGVDLVSLTVTVTDPKRQLIRDLSASDFAVVEDGVTQTVRFFGADTVPLDLAVMIDCSASMVDKLPFVQHAAAGLVQSLRAGDRVEVISFRDAMDVAQRMTANHGDAVRAIQSLTAAGNTSLFTALYVTLRELGDARPTEVRRRAVVLLSDGEDTKSAVTYDTVMDLARRSGVSIYTVALNSRIDRIFDQQGVDEGNFTMRGLAESTGARSFFPSDLSDVRAVYDSIASELASQYSIGYLPTNAVGNGAWRRVAVRVTDRPGATARSRPGYYASTSVAALEAILRRGQ